MDWNEILSGVEDLNDPTLYEKVLIAIDDVYCEDEDFMQVFLFALNLTIVRMLTNHFMSLLLNFVSNVPVVNK